MTLREQIVATYGGKDNYTAGEMARELGSTPQAVTAELQRMKTEGLADYLPREGQRQPSGKTRWFKASWMVR